MLICHSKRFVILAPWKTASQTVLLRLGRYSEGSYDQFYDFNHVLGRVVHQHMTCADFAALPEARLGYFVASFVRNPYDRVYSGFQQLQEDLVNQPRCRFRLPWVREFVMRQLADNFSQLCAAGFDFDKWVALIRDDQVFEAARNTSFSLHPAYYWTHLGDRQFVDFIGRVETFEEDFDRLCAQLDVIPDGRGNANVRELSSGPAYRYAGKMARASIDRINELFREDFERFGYKPLGEFERLKSPLTLADRLSTQKAPANQAVAERDEQIVGLKQAVAERDEQIVSLNQAVAERDEQIVSLNQAVAERDGQVRELQVLCDHNDQAARHFRATLNQIQSSHGWRALQRYYRLRDKLFPAIKKRSEAKFLGTLPEPESPGSAPRQETPQDVTDVRQRAADNGDTAKAKCFGIGLNKTGTKTLRKALRTLGYRMASFRPDLMEAFGEGRSDPAIAAAEHCDGFEDWPWPLLYKELDCAFPRSKFILTIRLDAAIWFESVCKHSKRTGPTPFRKIAYDYVNPWENREHHIRIYEDHISNVIEHFRDRPHQLLTVCWEKGDGWPELCRFLGVKVPEMPFPHENRSPEEQPQIRNVEV